ncbi:MAG: Type 1 glutamine amidotransferase-like domain-containing protein [Oscillospiraceae bacterium]|nr:Type 1 glutamine amidotransferase-like domain-containing protein [Oscillospiraceae bacterium]
MNDIINDAANNANDSAADATDGATNATGGASDSATSAASATKGTPALLLAGGRPSGATDMARMLSNAFKAYKNPKVAYIGAASGDSFMFFKMMKSLLTKAGANKVTFVRLAKDKIDINAAKATLSSSDVIFFSGGEVEDGINCIKKHQLAAFLHDLYNQGKQFVGVSAGTIMLGSHWVRWEDPKDDSTAELFDCLGIVPLVFDTHAEDEDWIELKAVLRLQGDGALGYGLPSGCAVAADSEGTLTKIEKEYLVFKNSDGKIGIAD